MLRRIPLHPFLLIPAAILPIFTAHIDVLRIEELVLPLAVGWTGVVIVWVLVSLFVRKTAESAILVSTLVILYFSAGCLLNLIIGPDLTVREHSLAANVPEDSLTELRILGWVIRIAVTALCTIVFSAVAIYFLRGPRDMQGWTLSLNVFTLVLVVVPLVQTVYETGLEPWNKSWYGKTGEDRAVRWTAGNAAKRPPDIYYLILDGYGRADVLREIYGYDNRQFLDQLRSRGFYVANRSSSNYAQTFLSLASSLNYRYLNHQGNEERADTPWRTKIVRSLRHSRIREFLEGRGYLFVAFSGGCAATEIADAAVYEVPPAALSEFQNVLLRIIPFGATWIPATKRGAKKHAERILYTVENVTSHTRSDRPCFVFCHICCPHPPFVFGKDGKQPDLSQALFGLGDGSHYHHMDPAKRMEYVELYRLQVSFLNKLVLQAVDRILADSTTPPVIVIQADHGPGSRLNWSKGARSSDLKERMAILNAYHLPGAARTMLYETISPVNTFRVILQAYFGVPIRLLEDKSYFSTVQRPLDFVEFREDSLVEQGISGRP